MLQFTKDDIMHGIELGVMMLLGLVVLFMVVRPLVRRILAAEAVAAPAEARCRPRWPMATPAKRGELPARSAPIAGASDDRPA